MKEDNEPKYWVVASGDDKHDYVDVCLNYGIIAIGPGKYGPYKEKKTLYKKNINEIGRNHLRSIKWISDNNLLKKDRDLVLLRKGIK